MDRELIEKYILKVKECVERLNLAESLVNSYSETGSHYEFENAVLQMRKGLECLAYAAICPNKEEYKEFRAKADRQPDYTKDFKAREILNNLTKINKDFYPTPISPPVKKSDGEYFFDRRNDDSLSQKQFEKFYDRLGVHLHADNPWGKDKGVLNLSKDILKIIASVRLLLSWHFTVIRKDDFKGLWVVQVPIEGGDPVVVIGQAHGEFVVT